MSCGISLMQPGQSVAQKFTRTTWFLSDAIDICLPSMVLNCTSGAVGLLLNCRARKASIAITMIGNADFFNKSFIV